MSNLVSTKKDGVGHKQITSSENQQVIPYYSASIYIKMYETTHKKHSSIAQILLKFLTFNNLIKSRNAVPKR